MKTKRVYTEAQKKAKKEYKIRWRAANPDYAKEYYDANKEDIVAQQKQYRDANKEAKRAKNKAWKQQNPDKHNAASAKRRASKLQRTPPWLNEDHLKEMQYVYAMAKEAELMTGERHHVDHIVPLQGENVSGLHVPWNLQVLPAELNGSKSNQYNEWD